MSPQNQHSNLNSPSQSNDSLRKLNEQPTSQKRSTNNLSQQPQVQSPTPKSNLENTISVDLGTASTSNEAAPVELNGPYSSSSSTSSASSSSTSSSTSSISGGLANNQTVSKSPRPQGMPSTMPQAPPVQQQQPQQQQQQHAQPMQIAQNGGLYYSPVVSPFAFIDNQTGVYIAAPNGLTSAPPPPTVSNQAQHIPLAPHQFAAYQPQQMTLMPSHHPNQQANVGANHMAQPPSQSPSYFNLIPMMPAVQGPPQQAQGPQPSATFQSNGLNANNSNNSTNCATPTPGSSPNTVSNMPTSNNPAHPPNYTGPFNMQGAQPQPYNSANMEHHVLNPYSLHHMMALVASSNNQQQQQQQQQHHASSGQLQPINPNMVMMMMMNPPPTQVPIGQLPPPLISANATNKQLYNFQHYQPYRSLTPTLQQQQQQHSPSFGSNLINYSQQQQQQQYHNSRKKLSCYNCGSMSHIASECKEPTLESISQPSNF